MKKILFSGICCLFFQLPSFAQVGVNTNNPIGVLDVNVLGDQPAKDNQEKHLVVDTNKAGEATVIIGNPSASAKGSTSLELTQPNKALLLNKVPLTGLIDTETVANPDDGMCVYNTETSPGRVDNDPGVSPGVYFNWGKTWLRLKRQYIGQEETPVNIREFGTPNDNTAIGTGNPYQATTFLTNPKTGAGAALIYTREPSSDNTVKGTDSFSVDVDGKYIFIFRFYGHPFKRSTGTTVITDREYYVYLFKRDEAGVETILSKTLVKPWISSNFNTASAVLTTPFLKAGDNIVLKMGQVEDGDPNEWRLIAHDKTKANRTSFVYFTIN